MPTFSFLKHLELRNIYLYAGVNKAYKINLVPSAYESGSLIRDFIRSKTLMQTAMTDKTVQMLCMHMHFSLDQRTGALSPHGLQLGAFPLCPGWAVQDS